MIRELRQDDWEDIVAMVQVGDIMHRDDIIYQLGREGKSVVYDDGQIKGLGLSSTSKSGSAGLRLYVHPSFRWQGIGRQLWDELQPIFAEGVNQCTTHYRIDQEDPSDFYCARGFQRWYRMHQMEYRGGRLPEPDLEVRPYSDDQFQCYAALINDGFTRLREIGDFRPYRIYPDEAVLDQALRERVLATHSDNTHLFYRDGKLVGVAEMANHEIDTVAVAPAWRGQGYGRQIANFSVNWLLERGADPVSLYVLAYNDSARTLYESMGFRIVQTLEYARWQRQEDAITQTGAER